MSEEPRDQQQQSHGEGFPYTFDLITGAIILADDDPRDQQRDNEREEEATR